MLKWGGYGILRVSARTGSGSKVKSHSLDGPGVASRNPSTCIIPRYRPLVRERVCMSVCRYGECLCVCAHGHPQPKMAQDYTHGDGDRLFHMYSCACICDVCVCVCVSTASPSADSKKEKRERQMAQGYCKCWARALVL